MCVGAPRTATSAASTVTGLIGGDAAGGVHDQRLAGELIDDVQQLQDVPVGGVIELEIERPDVVGAPKPVIGGSPPTLRTMGA